MALDRKIIRERFDIAVVEVAKLAKLGYSVVPMSVKMSGVVMYVTMEINTVQLEDVPTANETTEAVTPTVDVESDSNPVSAKVKVASSRTKVKAKDA